MFTDYTANQVANILADHPLPEGEDFFDAIEQFRGPEPEPLDYTPEQDAHYAAWKAKRQAKAKGETLEQRRAKAKAKVMAFYTAHAIANELSPFDN